ncbi:MULTISPECIES: ATP-binding protein [unclassified Streptomyces]|uniref:ATP-binding protein n=1 Tax=unclassified Streptomyces TaxID=2593676 RepID=UPI00343C6930
MDTMSVNVATVRSATSVAGARESARAFLDGLVHPAIAAEAADTVVLVVSELVTNALRHGGGTCTLDLTAHPDSIEVTVHDRSPRAPRMRTPDLNGGTGGFGWPMVNRLACATAVTRRAADSKTVSALLAR